MKCKDHGKEVLGSCQWCGKQLCRLCTGKRLGNKLFCNECDSDIGDIIERRQLDMIRQEKDKTKRKREYNELFG